VINLNGIKLDSWSRFENKSLTLNLRLYLPCQHHCHTVHKHKVNVSKTCQLHSY